MSKLQQALIEQKILVLDGGMGSQLAARGLDISAIDHNLLNPDTVLAVHQDYIAAGADCLLTNTLTLNDIYRAKKGCTIDLTAANLAGARLAREAAGHKIVLGDIGPTGQILKPLGNGDADEYYAAYQAQARALAAGGVDGFLIETVFDLAEAIIALKACLSVSSLPVLVSLTFSTLKKGGRTVMGNSAADCAKRVKAEGGAAIGANCGDLSPDELAEVVANMAGEGLPVLVEPNAGKPKLNGTDIYYDLSVADFAAGMQKCLAAGATIVGGCCGTTPAHIAALADLVNKLK